MPPKVARRKKQQKEQPPLSETTAIKKNDVGDDDEYDEDYEAMQEERPAQTNNRTSKSSNLGSVSSNIITERAAVAAAAAAAAATPEDDRVWVQCNTCDKWRALPSSIDPALLPDIWFCELNVYDMTRNCCEALEESYNEGTDEPLKAFLKLWTKKLRTADKAETRLSSSAVTRGRKKRSEVEWIRCCSPSCGKWRAVVRSVDPTHMLNRLSKGRRWGSKSVKWYCSMNSWDETQASCASPQEQLYDCKWNIGAGGGGSNSSSSGSKVTVEDFSIPSSVIVSNTAIIAKPSLVRENK